MIFFLSVVLSLFFRGIWLVVEVLHKLLALIIPSLAKHFVHTAERQILGTLFTFIELILVPM